MALHIAKQLGCSGPQQAAGSRQRAAGLPPHVSTLRRSHAAFSAARQAGRARQPAPCRAMPAEEQSQFDVDASRPARTKEDADLGPRSDNVLPDSLAGAVADAAEATADAVTRGNTRCQVEILLPEFWDPISGPIFPNRGDQERFWRMTRRFVEQLAESTGIANIKAVCCSGATSLWRHLPCSPWTPQQATRDWRWPAPCRLPPPPCRSTQTLVWQPCCRTSGRTRRSRSPASTTGAPPPGAACQSPSPLRGKQRLAAPGRQLAALRLPPAHPPSCCCRPQQQLNQLPHVIPTAVPRCPPCLHPSAGGPFSRRMSSSSSPAQTRRARTTACGWCAR
jgi:hypothetical protein